MRTTLFIAIPFIVLASACYVAWHLWKTAPQGWKLLPSGLFVLWMATMVASFIFIERVPVKAATVLYEVGNTWMIAFLYLLLIFLLADAASLCRILPRALLRDSTAALLAVTGAVAAILFLGHLHYMHKYREELTITTDKPLEKPLTIVLASDLHLGYHNRRPELARWVDLINAEKPDLVLFGGDIVDMSMRPILEGRYQEEFRRIDAPVWAVLGNHEYYGDIESAERFYKDAGILLLKDSTASFKGVDVIGRNDLSYPCRAALHELSDSLEGFTILLDHQPSNLEEASQEGIDFQFSGHTHHGQVWPVSWITDAVFEKAWGHYRKGDTRYYISSGLGIWGSRVRVGTRSEYLVLHLTGPERKKD